MDEHWLWGQPWPVHRIKLQNFLGPFCCPYINLTGVLYVAHFCHCQVEDWPFAAVISRPAHSRNIIIIFSICCGPKYLTAKPRGHVCERFSRQAPRRGLWGFDGCEGLDREVDEFEVSMNSRFR